MSVSIVGEISATDKFEKDLFSIIITIGVGNDTFTSQITELNSQPYNDSKITIEVVCATLDSTVTLAQFQGNQNDFTTMSPVLDSQSGLAVSDVLTNGNYMIYSSLRAFFLGLQLNPDSATTGTITIIGRV